MITIYPDGCPDEIEKFEFDVVVKEPDPDAADIATRKTATVTATYKGELAGELEYGFLLGDVVITRMKTVEKFQCRGCATQMVKALIENYPQHTVKDSDDSNDEVGEVVLARWREKGILNDA